MSGSIVVVLHHPSDLAAVFDKMLPHWVQISVFCVGKEVRVVAALPELHDDVEDGRAAGVSAVNGVDVAHKHSLVYLPLDLRHP